MTLSRYPAGWNHSRNQSTWKFLKSGKINRYFTWCHFSIAWNFFQSDQYKNHSIKPLKLFELAVLSILQIVWRFRSSNESESSFCKIPSSSRYSGKNRFLMGIADKVCLWDNVYSFERKEAPIGIIWWTPGPRIMSEIVPHFSQCFLMLFMSFERYILVCHPIQAEQILTPKRRSVFYVVATLIVLSIPIATFFTYNNFLKFDRD